MPGAQVQRHVQGLLVTHFQVPAVEMLFDESLCCPIYGALTFDGLAVDGQGRFHLVVRTAAARAYLGPDAATVARRIHILVTALVDGLNLLHAHDITFAMASPAPQTNLKAYAQRMGWTDLPWYTIRTDAFTADFGATEWFALNVFLRVGDAVYRTYFLQNGPMVSHIGSVRSLLSLTPYGGQIEGEDVPDGWPQDAFSFWMRRHDEFDEPAPSARN